MKGNTFNWCAKCKRWTTTHTTATHTGKPNDKKENRSASASLLEYDPSVWCLSYSLDQGSVTREMRKTLQAIAAVLPVSLDPEGSFGDHLSTIEHKVYEQKCKGDFNQRLAKLEWEFETLEDYTDLFMVDSNETLFPVDNESPSSSDEECPHKDKKHKIFYNICRYTYLSLCISSSSWSCSRFDVGNV